MKWLPIFEFPKIWKIALRIFQIFEKPFSNFEFCFEKYVKQYLDAYIFGGNSTSHSQLISIYHQFTNRNARFPQKSQASNIDLQWSNSIIGNFEDGSSKISKIGRGIFQIFEYSKNSKKTNEWCHKQFSKKICKRLLEFLAFSFDLTIKYGWKFSLQVTSV